MNFNEKLQNLRKEKGLSQEELGEKLDVTRQTISKWELGSTSPKLDDLIKISDLFNISIDELTGKKEELNSNNTEDAKKKKSHRLLFKVLRMILLTIFVLYISTSIYKYMVIKQFEKDVKKVTYLTTTSYALSYDNTTLSDIIEYKYMLFDGNINHMVDTLNDIYMTQEFDYGESDQDPTIVTVRKYNLKDKTYTIEVGQDASAEFNESLHFYNEMFSEINSNIVSLMYDEKITFNIKQVLFAFNPLNRVYMNRDGIQIQKGLDTDNSNYYLVALDKNNDMLFYMRQIVSKNNKANQEHVSYYITNKEAFEEYLSGYNFNEYTLVEE